MSTCTLRRSIAWAPLVIACGPQPGDVGADASGTESETVAAASTDGGRPPDDGTNTSMSASEDSGESDAGSAGDPVGDSTGVAVGTVTIRGTVYDQYAPPRAPVAGAVLYLDTDSSVMTVSDATGQFELVDVPGGTPAWIQVAPDEVSMGTIHGVAVPDEGVVNVELFRWDRAAADAIERQLQAMDPSVGFGGGTGSLVVVSDLPSTTISLSPMPPPGNYYALDGSGAPVLDALSSDFAEAPFVVFFDLSGQGVGDLEVTATHESGTCDVPLPSPPVSIQYASFAHVTCR